jgi:DNA mismatch endonuclease (patch repair protein)
MPDRNKATYAYDKLRETLVVAEATRRSMQGNRSVGTKPEEALRQALWAAGLRGYRKNVKGLPGKPDVVFGKAKVAIFVHGCYWHQCPHCQRNRTPKTNARYWHAKFNSNRERDERNQAQLLEMGYQVLVVWECKLKSELEAILAEVRVAVLGDG